MSDYLWLLMVAGGPALMALVIAYALMRQRRLKQSELARRGESVDRLYERR